MIAKYLVLSPNGKQDLLSQTAARMGVDPVIVEKDLWVCAILGVLFTHPETRDRFVFKGGTSLSKVYGVIQRFSEDIDLIVDWRLLGLGGADSDPWDAGRSRTRQDKFNKALGTKTEAFLRETFVPFLQSQLPTDVNVSVSDAVAQGVVVQYPAIFSSAYVQDGVLLEIGALASWVPSVWKAIIPEVSRYYPEILGDEALPVKVTTAERTFWEKVTIAHQIAYSNKEIPPRYARHFYDIVMLSRSGVVATALQDVELLRSVADFKERFYPSRAARYDLARPGTVRILPGEERLAELARDYRKMATMFYVTPPDWQAVVSELRRLELSINATERKS
jgi:hypothetical protein